MKNTAITFEYVTPSITEFQERLRNTMKKYPYLVIEKDGLVVGYAYSGVFKGRAAYDWACEMTVYLDHEAHKCGLGRMIYEALEDRFLQCRFLSCYMSDF